MDDFEPEFLIFTDRTPSYDEVREFIGGYIEAVQMPNGAVLLCDEDGRMRRLPYNDKASMYWYDQRKANGEDWIDPNCIVVSNAVVIEAAARGDDW